MSTGEHLKANNYSHLNPYDKVWQDFLHIFPFCRVFFHTLLEHFLLRLRTSLNKRNNLHRLEKKSIPFLMLFNWVSVYSSQAVTFSTLFRVRSCLQKADVRSYKAFEQFFGSVAFCVEIIGLSSKPSNKADSCANKLAFFHTCSICLTFWLWWPK